MPSLPNAPDADAMHAMAMRALAKLPPQFARHLAAVVIQVAEAADADTLASVGLDHPLDLTGVYIGVPLGDKSIEQSAALPDRIILYRQAILAEAASDGHDVERLVGHVLVHEIGHHFGLSDEAMHALEDMVD
jgi:predicted Zn-dependent protease with MMP-like domain